MNFIDIGGKRINVEAITAYVVQDAKTTPTNRHQILIFLQGMSLPMALEFNTKKDMKITLDCLDMECGIT